VRAHFDTGDTELFIAASHDSGRTYGAPLLLHRSTAADLAGMEELAQVAVRPDGTVDAVWNAVRDGAPLILHASSTDGGASFSPPDVVAPLLPEGNRLGIVTSLAVSPAGRLAVCWSQAPSPDHYDALVRCTATDGEGAWQPSFAILAGWRGRQYLPAAAFQGERLWAAAYVSTGHETRVVSVPGEAGGAAEAVVLNGWPVSRRRVCAPHPPDCRDDQTFIGDYIGLVATPDRVTAAYIAPSPDASQQNQVLASSFTPAG
jgi:hypothetical protein